MVATPLFTLCLFAGVTSLFVSPYIRNVPGSQVWGLVQSSDFLSAIITYTDSNELCEKLEPHLLTVAENYKNMMRFYAVECHTVVEYECTPEMEKTLPGLVLSYPMGLNYTTGENQFFKERYTGQMHMKTFGEYLLGKMPFYGYQLDFSTMPTFIKSPAFNKTVLFTDKETVPSLFKALSAQYRDKLQFAVVWKNQTELAHKYSVKFYPTILTFAKGKTFEYDGELNFDDLKWYYSLHAAPTKAEYVTETPPELKIDQVKPVAPGDFSKTLKSSKKLVISLFFDAQTPKEEWEEIRTVYKGMATFVQVNCSSVEGKEIADLHGVTSFPAYVLHPINRALPAVPFSLSNASAIINSQYRSEIAVLDNLPGETFLNVMKTVNKLVTVLVADEITLAYHILASDIYLKSISLFMYTSGASGQLPGGFPIKKRPTIMSLSQVGEAVHIQEYTGSVSDFSQLKYHFEDVMAEFYHNTHSVEDDYSEETIDELMDKTFTKMCSKKTPYCMIALLNGPYDDPSNAETIALMKQTKAYSERTAKPFRFAWVDARCEFEFLRDLTLFETQLPAFLFYQGVYNRTMPLLEKVDATKLKLQIDKISAGKWPSEDTASLSLTDRECSEVYQFFESVNRVPNEHRRKEIIDTFYKTEEFKQQSGKGNKRTARKNTDL